MKNRLSWPILPLVLIVVAGTCTDSADDQRDLVNDDFPEVQAELREAINAIGRDILSANIDGLTAIHLRTDKFTKFGPRRFDRQDVVSTNASEADFWGSVSARTYEARELKVDVFGDVGIATYYPHVTFVRDGKEATVNGRQTLVFLRTADGWKIVHEHGTVGPGTNGTSGQHWRQGESNP